MSIFCLGLSHKTASLAVREQLACPSEQLDRLFMEQHLLAAAGVTELAILSTCNRLELYAGLGPGEPADDEVLLALRRFLTRQWGLDESHLDPHLYFHEGIAAVAHLCRVAAGLDSMVLGEPQILGQVAVALQQSQEAGAAGPLLEAAFIVAIRAGKRARTETGIGRHAGSVGSVAVRMAQSVLPVVQSGAIEDAHIAVLGAGEMAKLVLLALHKRKLRRVTLLNRTPDAAEELSNILGARHPVHGLDKVPEVLASADIIICSTSAPEIIISADDVRWAMAQRPDRPLLMIDIAVPRDVAPEASVVPGVHLLDLDDLQAHLNDALAEREAEIPHVEAIVAEMVAAFEDRLAEIELTPLIKALRYKAEAIRERELERTLRHLPDLTPEAEAHIRHLAQSLVNKLLHEPTLRLRHEARNGNDPGLATAARALFGLPPEEPC